MIAELGAVCMRWHAKNVPGNIEAKQADLYSKESMSISRHTWRRKKIQFCSNIQNNTMNHDGQEFQLNIKIISRCFGKPTTRLITEAVLINELGDDETLNSRKEWSYVKLPRATITRYWRENMIMWRQLTFFVLSSFSVIIITYISLKKHVDAKTFRKENRIILVRFGTFW